MRKKIIIILCMLTIFFVLYLFMKQPLPGHIIFLQGGSSVGKTAIIKELQTRLQDKYIVSSIDDFVWIVLRQKIEEKGISCNVTSAHDLFKIFMTGLSIENRSAIFKELHNENWMSAKLMHLEKIKQLAHAGKNVIADVVLGSFNREDIDIFKKELKDFNKVMVWVYCSPQCLVDHVEQRNKASNFADSRDVIDVLYMFVGLHTIAHDNEKVVDVLDKQVLDEIIFKNFDRLQKLTFALDIKQALYDLELVFDKVFNLNTLQQVKVTPKYEYDLLVDSGKYNPQECAQQIKEYFEVGNIFTII